MADDKYNSVEITEEDKSSLTMDETQESGTYISDSDIPEPEELLVQEEQDEGMDLDSADFTIDGETYSSEDIQQWMNDSQNKEEWQRSNTQKAQDLSKWNKLVGKISDDEKFREYLGDYFYDNPDELQKVGLDGKAQPLDIEQLADQNATKSASEEMIEHGRLSSLEEQLDTIQMDKLTDEIEAEFDTIVDENPGFFETKADEMEFLEFCSERGISDMGAGFQLYTWDFMNDELEHMNKLSENGARNDAVISERTTGGPEVNAPRSYKAVNDITLDDPDIAKYFDK